MPGPSEWLIIAIVAIVVIFGAKKIPEMARSMGRAQSEFKKGVKEGQAELGETPPAAAAPAATPPASPPPTEAAPPAAPAPTETTGQGTQEAPPQA
jgi:sec-independent protein translocase protein TatA